MPVGTSFVTPLGNSCTITGHEHCPSFCDDCTEYKTYKILREDGQLFSSCPMMVDACFGPKINHIFDIDQLVSYVEVRKDESFRVVFSHEPCSVDFCYYNGTCSHTVYSLVSPKNFCGRACEIDIKIFEEEPKVENTDR